MESTQKNLTDALLVMLLTPHIQAYLRATDPKSLEQAVEALKNSGVINGSTGEDFALPTTPVAMPDYTKVQTTGVACDSGKSDIKQALAMALTIASSLSGEIGLYVDGRPFEYHVRTIIGSFQRFGDVGVQE